MLIIETTSPKLSGFQEKCMHFAAKENVNEVTDINRLYGKLQVIAESGNDEKYLQFNDYDEIVIKNYSDETTLTIIELHPVNN